jgi:hypothetical protein
MTCKKGSVLRSQVCKEVEQFLLADLLLADEGGHQFHVGMLEVAVDEAAQFRAAIVLLTDSNSENF